MGPTSHDQANASPLQSVAAQLPNGALPLPAILTAGQFHAAHVEPLASAGVRMVLDLRPASEPRGFEEAAAVTDAGMRYENVPVTQQTLVRDDFARVRSLLADPANRPAVVHCASANRVGALLLPQLVLDEGRTEQEAVAVARQIGLRSQELLDAALAYLHEQQDRQ